MKFEWEELYFDPGNELNELTYRAKVFGGWIVKNFTRMMDSRESPEWIASSESMVFIPDPEHKWEITLKRSVIIWQDQKVKIER